MMMSKPKFTLAVEDWMGRGCGWVQRMGLGLGSGAVFLRWYYRLRRAAWSSSGVENWEARVFVFEIWVHESAASGVQLVEVVGREEGGCQVGW